MFVWKDENKWKRVGAGPLKIIVKLTGLDSTEQENFVVKLEPSDTVPPLVNFVFQNRTQMRR